EGRASRRSQVGHMPSARIPPQLIDVLISAEVVYMLSVLVLKGIAVQHAAGSRQWRASRSRGQVVRVSSPLIPPQLMNVLICTDVIHMLGVLVLKGIAAQRTTGSRQGCNRRLYGACISPI